MPNIYGEVNEFSNLPIETTNLEQNESKSPSKETSSAVGAKNATLGSGPSNENIRVFLRMRPFNQSELEQGESQNCARKWILSNQNTTI